MRPPRSLVDFARRAERDAMVHELATIEQHRWAAMVAELLESGVPIGTRVAVGRDIESASLLFFASGLTGGSNAGTTATAPTATTFTTDAKNFTANSLVGQMIVTTSGANRFGIVQSNTAATNSVLTIDRWYDPASVPANPGVAAASTPTAGAWVLVPGNAPGAYMALTATATAAVDGDTVLTGEITTASGGLIRSLATYAHTAAGTTTTLTNTFTANGSDTLPVTVAQIGVFQGVVVAACRMIFRSVLNATATLTISGDQVQVTDTVTL